jgi:aarF domain-containing kinase
LEQVVSQPDIFMQYSRYIAEVAIEEADQLDEYNARSSLPSSSTGPFLLAHRLVQIAVTMGWWVGVCYGDTLFSKKDQNFKVWLRSHNSPSLNNWLSFICNALNV